MIIVSDVNYYYHEDDNSADKVIGNRIINNCRTDNSVSNNSAVMVMEIVTKNPLDSLAPLWRLEVEVWRPSVGIFMMESC